MPERRIYYSEEARQIAQQRQMVQLTVAVLIALMVGATIALLFAPQSGKKLRRQIAQAIDEGYQRGREETGDLIDRLEAEFPGVRRRVEELIGRNRA
ncbi:MAG: YtxH domain-containing protein [Aggregatilineales bacterium]|jgi:gas vesicle protein|nr:YtxH domain-containing protein [Aggregatilineales bacterium]HPV06203.1 YtxH domain-containing protein [Aggregatilineales bacterium]HQE19919.1 YtxH domain-containing protein [Aggregatilineales bacterium]